MAKLREISARDLHKLPVSERLAIAEQRIFVLERAAFLPVRSDRDTAARVLAAATALVSAEGLEPSTGGLRVRCSTN